MKKVKVILAICVMAKGTRVKAKAEINKGKLIEDLSQSTFLTYRRSTPLSVLLLLAIDEMSVESCASAVIGRLD
jgi:hypothetical protein